MGAPHTAKVWPYSANPKDTELSYRIECPECGTRWGYAYGSDWRNLERDAEHHNYVMSKEPAL